VISELSLPRRVFPRSLSQQGTFAIERQLSRDIAVTASYIWSRGINLFTQRDLNLATRLDP